MYSETIYALSSASGRAGVSVIRISGPHIGHFFEHCLSIKNITPRVATLASLYHPKTKEILDKSILIFFPQPNSFTGEDVLELHIHGSIAVIQDVLIALSQLDSYRLAEAGEFSRRAFYNDKMDLTEIEGLADLIDSETTMQRRQALRQMSGNLSKIYQDWRQRIIKILAFIEAEIDFIEEDDVPDNINHKTLHLLQVIQHEIKEHLNDNRKGERLRSGFHVALIGAPNTGKSSLLNMLAQRDIAIVSPYEGTTRDVLEAHLDIGGYPILLVDTAGIRETDNPIEKQGIERSKKQALEADMNFYILEALDPELDIKISEMSRDTKNWIIVNKIDLCRSIPANKSNIFYISAKLGSGIDALLKGLESYLQSQYHDMQGHYITRLRYRKALTNCVERLTAITPNQDIELVAENLRLACRSLEQIMGKVHVEDLLDIIFQEFCIGK